MVDLFFTINFYFPAKFLRKSRVTCWVISMVYTLIEHSSRPISTRGFIQLLLNSVYEQMLVKTRHWPATVKKSISLILSSLIPYHVRRTPVQFVLKNIFSLGRN